MNFQVIVIEFCHKGEYGTSRQYYIECVYSWSSCNTSLSVCVPVCVHLWSSCNTSLSVCVPVCVHSWCSCNSSQSVFVHSWRSCNSSYSVCVQSRSLSTVCISAGSFSVYVHQRTLPTVCTCPPSSHHFSFLAILQLGLAYIDCISSSHSNTLHIVNI